MEEKKNFIFGAVLIIIGASLISTVLGMVAVRVLLTMAGLLLIDKGLLHMTGISLVQWIQKGLDVFFQWMK